MHVVDDSAPELLARDFDLAPHLGTRALGRLLEVHPRLGSTNARALALARRGAAHGTTVVAVEQTEGRGQRGKRWYSPPGAGLYASVVLRPSLSPRLASALTLVAGVALQQALHDALGVRARLRWPNDLLAAKPGEAPRKISGILVEASADQTRLEHAVLGLGVNLAEPGFPEPLAAAATSLEALTGRAPAAPAVLGPALDALEAALDEVERDGLAPAAERWTARALGLGDRVQVDDGEGLLEGTLLGIAEDGALRLRTPAGERALYRGELRIPGVPKTPAEF